MKATTLLCILIITGILFSCKKIINTYPAVIHTGYYMNTIINGVPFNTDSAIVREPFTDQIEIANFADTPRPHYIFISFPLHNPQYKNGFYDITTPPNGAVTAIYGHDTVNATAQYGSITLTHNDGDSILQGTFNFTTVDSDKVTGSFKVKIPK